MNIHYNPAAYLNIHSSKFRIIHVNTIIDQLFCTDNTQIMQDINSREDIYEK